MGQVLVTESSLQNIANAIRTVSGSTDTYTPAEMAGAITNMSTTPVLKPGVLLPAAESVKTMTYDKYLNADEKITIPAYTTTSTTLIANSVATTTYTCDFSTYDYYVLIRMATIPEYNISSVAKGRQEYALNSALYEITSIPANTIHALINPSLYITANTNGVYSAGNLVRLVYYSSNTAISAYSTAAYGYNQTVQAPALSGSTLTLKSPAFIVRGHTTYLTSTYMNAVTDVRYQYIEEVFRVKKGDYNIDGWGLVTQWNKMNSDILATGHKLK